MKVLVVINPKSGGGKGLHVGKKVREHYQGNLDVTFIEGSSLQETLDSLAIACNTSKYSHLVSVGGDGLVHDLLPILIKHNLTLLIVPAGTGNDFARTLGLYKLSLTELLQLPNHRTPEILDIGLVEHGSGSSPFIQVLSTGFDSVVNERANNFKWVKGSIKYVIAVLMKIWKFRAVNYEISIDGVPVTTEAMLVCVANGTSYGGGMKIVPHASVHDGVLDVMVVDKVSPLRMLLVFPRVFLGTHVTHPKVHLFTGRQISLTGDTVAFADGELIAPLPISVRLSDQKLLVFRG